MDKQQFKKKIDNFWYYYKVPVIAVVAVLLIVLYFLCIGGKAPDYDYQVAFLTCEPISDTKLEDYGDTLASFGKDRNGDGDILVNVIPYLFSKEDTSDPQRALATQVQFTADTQLGTTPLILYSREAYETFKENHLFLQGENSVAPWEDNEDLFLFLMDFQDIDEDQQGKVKDYYKDCQALLAAFQQK